MVAPYVPIENVIPRTQSIAGLNQFIYSTNWTANDASDIQVYSRLPNVPASDALQLVDPSLYTVQFIGSDNIVQVTFLPLHNPPQYNIITIVRNTPSEFLNLYTNTNFTPSMLNSDFETLTLIDQQNQIYWQQIGPRYNTSALVNDPVDLKLPILGANQFWIKNSTNTAIVPMTFTSGGGGGGGVPTNAPLVIYTADPDLSSSVNLGALDSGILAQMTVTGIAFPFTIPIPLDVPHGGTGVIALTPYSVLVAGATSVDPISPITDIGTAGQVLTSAGPGLPPSFQTPGDATGGIVNVQYITSSGTYTPTAGATSAIVEVVGGGGGSGGCSATIIGQSAISGGGGGAGYARKYLTTLTSQTVTIGAGGTAGSAGVNAGGNGGTTSFGAIVSASGGNGSAGGAVNTSAQPVNGGIGIGGDINISGSQGGWAQILTGTTTTPILINSGGSSFYAGTVYTTNSVASAGIVYGGGASGNWQQGSGGSAQAGATGGAGICIITEYT